MAGPVAKKDDSLVREELRQYLQEIDVKIVREFDEGEFNGFWVRFGDFPILIENQKGKSYYIVAFQITLPEGPETAALNANYSRKDAAFIYDLTRAFTSPLTGFSRIIEGGMSSASQYPGTYTPFTMISLSKTSTEPSRPWSARVRSVLPS